MCRNIYAANTASEHISADEEAIAAPDIPISKPKSGASSAECYQYGSESCHVQSFCLCNAYQNERKARNGKENNNPQIRQSK